MIEIQQHMQIQFCLLTPETIQNLIMSELIICAKNCNATGGFANGITESESKRMNKRKLYTFRERKTREKRTFSFIALGQPILS